MIELITSVSKVVGISAQLLIAVCTVETNCTMKTVYDNGSYSYGAFQLKYNTARGLDPTLKPKHLEIPAHNVFYAAMYLKQQLRRYNGDVDCAIAAYNAGSCKKEGNVIKNAAYVNKVKRNWKRPLAIRTWVVT